MRKGTKHTVDTKKKLRIAQYKLLDNGKITTKGYKHTDIARKKMSNKKKGCIPWNKGKKGLQIAWNKNKKGLQKAWNKGLKGYLAGEEHYNWQGGISFEPYGLEFNEDLKEVIRNRDRRKCQICKKIELENKEKLTVHHIDYNKQNNNPNNLISLCRKCHSKTNYNRDYWIEYFKTKF